MMKYRRLALYPFQNDTRISNCGRRIFHICYLSRLKSPRSRFYFGMGICLIFLISPLWAQSTPVTPIMSTQARTETFLKYLSISEKESRNILQNGLYVIGAGTIGRSFVAENPNKGGFYATGAAILGVGYLLGQSPSAAEKTYKNYQTNPNQDPIPLIKELKARYAESRMLAAGGFIALAFMGQSDTDQTKNYTYPNDLDLALKTIMLSMAAYTLLTESSPEHVCQAVIEDLAVPTHQQTWHIGPHQNTLAVMTKLSF